MGTRGTAKVLVSDSNDIEYNLTVEYSITAGCPAHCDRNYGWSPPEGPELEQGEIRCESIVFNHSGQRTSVVVVPEKQLEIGNFCNETFGEKIRELVEEFAGEAEQRKHDPCDPRI